MTKKIMNVLIPIIIVLAIGMLYLVINSETDPKVGQVWVYDACGDNPFEEPCPNNNEVLEVKDGYVRYVDQLTGRDGSCSVRWFKIGSKLMPQDKLNKMRQLDAAR